MMEMTIRPMTPQERMYSYSQSQQLIMQTGCVGYMRGDFGSNGKGFFTDWNDHRKDLKTPAFQAEFDDVINALRENDSYGGVLKSRNAMSNYCYDHSSAGFDGNYDREFGFRVDTDHYSFMLRLNPNKADYNLYCFCYLRQWLDRNMEHAQKGIRFITPHYKEKFRLADGDQIRIVTKDGDQRDRTVRYIDETHLEVGNGRTSELYHICQFAELMENNGNTVIPLRASLPKKCFSVLEATGELIEIKKGERGYQVVMPKYDDMTPRKEADAVNGALGVTKAQEAAMVAGYLFGWDVPGADPKNYDENGTPIRPKHRDRGDAR